MLNRLRRCQLSVPGSSQKMITKSSSLDVDVIVLDLEDAVAPSQKTVEYLIPLFYPRLSEPLTSVS
jgi:hypothetical protein